MHCIHINYVFSIVIKACLYLIKKARKSSLASYHELNVDGLCVRNMEWINSLQWIRTTQGSFVYTIIIHRQEYWTR